jgi:hypothetical protein
MLQLFQMNVAKVDRMLHMLQWLYMYIAKVCSQCFIRVFGCIVASVFIWMLHTFHTYAASALSRYYVCLQWFSSVFASASEECFKCFLYLQTYVAIIASRCLKSKLSIAHVAVCVRSGGDMSGPYMRSSGTGPAWARET